MGQPVDRGLRQVSVEKGIFFPQKIFFFYDDDGTKSFSKVNIGQYVFEKITYHENIVTSEQVSKKLERYN